MYERKESNQSLMRILAKSVYVPTYAWNLWLGRILKVRRWWDEVEPRVYLGARPLRSDIKTFMSMGIRGVLNMCEEFSGPSDLYNRYKIEQLWLKTTDFHHPSIDQVIVGVEFIQKQVEQGNAVYVHCKAGRARSATIVLCWLMKYRGLSPNDAQSRILAARPHVNRSLYKRDVVREYENYFQRDAA